MTRDEAIHIANEWVRRTTGACVAPAAAELSTARGRRRWRIWYDTAALMRARGLNLPPDAVVDGPYVLVVDDLNGDVSVLG